MSAILIIPYLICGLLGALIFHYLLPRTDQDKEAELVLAVIWGPIGLLWALISLVYFKLILRKKPAEDKRLEIKKPKLEDLVAKNRA